MVPAGEQTPHWHVTFAVTDHDETTSRAAALGGHVVRNEDSDWTKAAVIVDPQGAEFTASQFTPQRG